MTASDRPVRMTEWQDSRGKRLLARLTLPLFYLLNRPSLHWFGKAAYDFALRCNGFAITFKGSKGLTLSEERFLGRTFAGRRPRVMLDVGANHGSYSKFLRGLAPDAAIYAFEPHPKTHAILSREVGPLGVRTVNQALSDQPGTLTLYDLAEHEGSTQASLSRDAVSLFSEGVLEYQVDVSTLDRFVAEHGIDHIDLLKVDTEGFDLAVLKGARETLAAGRIGVIQFEFIPANIATMTRMRDFIELLSGYTVYRMCLNGQLLPLTPYDVKRVEVYATQNLVALPTGTPPA